MAIPIQLINIFKGSKIQTFSPYYEEIVEYAELTNERRVALFFAHIGVETAYFNRFTENLNYSSVRLSQVWPNRFAVDRKATIKVPNALAKSIANKPQLIANTIYGGQYGNNRINDGWLYCGKGCPMLTFKSNYTSFSSDLSVFLGVNFVEHPEAILEPKNSIYAGAHFSKLKNINYFADKGDVMGSTKKWNGGLNGLKERQNLYNKIIKQL